MNGHINIRNIRRPPTIVKEEKKTYTDNRSGSIWEILNKEITIGSKKLSEKRKEELYNELAALLHAGLDIRVAIEIVRDEQKNKLIKELYDQLLQRIISGTTLSHSMVISQQFSQYEIYSVRIGEETGQLPKVLKDLAVYYQKNIKIKRQVISAISYPAIVLIVSLLAISFMIGFVVPMFADIFKRFGTDLPGITRLILAMAEMFSKYWIVVFSLLSLCIATTLYYKSTLIFRKISSRLILRIPYFNSYIVKIYLSRFANTLSMLMSAKIPLIQSLELAEKMIRFYPLENSLMHIRAQVLSGIPLHKAMSEYKIYPEKMITMVRVGEETNQLDAFFERISTQYTSETEYQSLLLGKLIEPIIIIVLGLIVGVVLVAMYLPLFKIGQMF